MFLVSGGLKGIKSVRWIVLFFNIIFLWSQKGLLKLQDIYNVCVRKWIGSNYINDPAMPYLDLK